MTSTNKKFVFASVVALQAFVVTWGMLIVFSNWRGEPWLFVALCFFVLICFGLLFKLVLHYSWLGKVLGLLPLFLGLMTVF